MNKMADPHWTTAPFSRDQEFSRGSNPALPDDAFPIASWWSALHQNHLKAFYVGPVPRGSDLSVLGEELDIAYRQHPRASVIELRKRITP